MSREELLEAIRGHLEEELGVAPDSISGATRFRDDLDADSLDLYTLLQELEDRFGLRLADEDAAKIETVDDAIDTVIAKLGGEQGS